MTLPKPARPDNGAVKQVWVNYLAAHGWPVELARKLDKPAMQKWKPGDPIPSAEPEPPVQNVDTSEPMETDGIVHPLPDEDNTEDNGGQYRQMDGTGTDADEPDIYDACAEAGRTVDLDVDTHRRAFPPNIQDAILGVMDVVGAIGKNEMNRTPGASYNFRGVDTVVNAVQPAFLMFGVTISPRLIAAHTRRSEKDTNNGGVLLWADVHMEYTLTARDGSSRIWSAPGAAMDSGDKAIGKACSVAYRIAMLQGLCIPTHDPDPDSVSYGDDEGYQTHGRGGQSREAQNARQQPAQGQRGPDYTAPLPENQAAENVRRYTLQVMQEFEIEPDKRWTGPDIIKKYWELFKSADDYKDYREETNVERLKAFGAQLRDDAVQDRAMEEARATQAVLDGLGGEVIGTPDDESEPIDAEVVPDAGE